MITIFTSTKQDASDLINIMGLSKDKNNTCYDTYSNDKIRLIITGTGKVNAAAAAGYCIGRFGADSCYINYGMSAALPSSYSRHTFFIGKIIDNSTGDEYFPDIAATIFPHCTLITTDRPVHEYEMMRDSFNRPHDASPILYDMEASGIFQVLKNFVTPDRIIIIKTDSENAFSSDTAEFISELASDKITKSTDALDNLLSQLSSELCCSETMHNQLAQYIRYIYASGKTGEFIKKTDELRKKDLLPVPDRKHGKQILTNLLMNDIY